MIKYDGKKTVSEYCQSIINNNFAIIYVPSKYPKEVTNIPITNGGYVSVYKSASGGYGIFVLISNDGEQYYCKESNGTIGNWIRK